MAGENLLGAISQLTPVDTSTEQVPLPLSMQKKEAISQTAPKKDIITNAATDKQIKIGGAPKPAPTLIDVVQYDQGLRGPEALDFSPEGQTRSAQMQVQRDEIRRMEAIERTTGDVYRDTAAGLVSGTANAVRGIAEIGNLTSEVLGIEDTPVGMVPRLVSDGLGKIAEVAQEAKSDNLEDIQQLSALEKQVRSEASEAQYEKDIASGKSGLISGLERVGRDTTSAVKAMVDNPATFTDALAENIPSLAVSAGGGALLARGAAKATLMGRGATEEAAEMFLKTSRGQELIRKTSITMQPGISGVQEGGGAGAQARDTVEAMTHEQLLANSPEYNELIKTVSPEEAKAAIASKVAQETAVVAGLSGVVTGHMTKAFDAAPFGVTGIGSIAKNLGGETTEEAIQGGVSTLGQNVAVQRHADETQDVLADVGAGIGEGAVAGLGISAVAQGPGAAVAGAVKTATTTAELAVKAKNSMVNALDARLGRQVEADAAITPETLAQGKVEATAAVEAIRAAESAPASVAEPVEGEEVPEAAEVAEAPVSSPILDKINNSYEINDEELAEIPEKIKGLVQTEGQELPRTRLDFIEAINNKIQDTSISEEDRAELSAEMITNIDVLYNLQDDETNAYVDSLDDANPVKSNYLAMTDYVGKFLANINLQKAQQVVTETPINEVTEENLDSVVKIANAKASVDPLSIDPDKGEEILNLSKKRKVALPENIVSNIQSAVNISRIATLHSQNVEDLTGTPTAGRKESADVREDVLIFGYDKGQKGSRLSIVDHAKEVTALAQSGQKEQAIVALKNLSNLAQNQLNKLGAFDKSSKTGKSQPYMAWSVEDQQFYSTATRKPEQGIQKYGVARFKDGSLHPNSAKLYRGVFADTSAIVAIQNTIANQFPELGIEPMELPYVSRSIAQREGILKPKAMQGIIARTPKESQPLSPTRAKKLKAAAGGTKPLTKHLTQRYGGVQVGSEAAIYLIDNGITPQNTRGLFKVKGGLTDVSNIVADPETLLGDKLGDKETGYLDPDSLAQALLDEVGDVPTRVTREQEDAAYEYDVRAEEQERLDREARERENEPSAKQESQETSEPETADRSGSDRAEETQPVDTVDEPETTSEEVEIVRNIAERFGNLYEGKFAKVFKNKPTRSLIANDGSPLAKTRDLYMAAKESVGASIIGRKFLQPINTMLIKANDRINRDFGRDKIKAAIKNKQDITTYRNLRSLIFTVQGENGLAYDEQIIESALLSGVANVLAIRKKPKIDADNLLQKQGIDLEGPVPKDIQKFLLDYEPSNQLVSNISRDMMKLMGIAPDSEALDSDARGSMESLAHEVLKIMEAEGLIEIKSQDFEKKTLSGVRIKEGLLNENEKQAIANNSNFLKDLLMPGEEPLFHVGKPARTKRTQAKTGIALSKKQIAAIENHNKIAFTPNMEFLGIADLMTEERMKRMRGYIDITEEMRHTYNKNHLISIEGKNQSIETEIRDVKAALEAIGVYQGNNNLEFKDTPVYFPHEATRVNRIQMVGPANPQSNKYARAALRSTWATLDMTNPIHQEGFWRTVVQMSGVKVNGKKLEYLKSKEVMEQGPEAIEAKYGPVLRELEKHFKEGTPDLDVIESGLMNTEPVVLESLTAVARLNVASEADKKAFRHSVPLEADGVTNGPAAVLMKFTTGDFNVEELAQWQRIGFFVSKDQKALHDREPKEDTYGLTSGVAQGNIKQRAVLLDQPETVEYRDAINRFIQKFNPKGVTVTDGVVEEVTQKIWELDRNAAKNPLTKTTYGAGKMGTARGIAGEAMEQFYKAISTYNQNKGGESFAKSIGYPELENDLKLLTEKYVIVSDKGIFTIAPEQAKPIITGIKGDASTSLNGDAFEALAQNLNTVYVTPLYEAVASTMGSSFDTMDTVINASKLQSVVLQKLYDRFIQSFESRTVPSPKEQKEWIERFKRLGAYIETEDQTFFVGGAELTGSSYRNEKGQVRDRDISSSTEPDGDAFKTAFRTARPGLAGVGAGAYVNIGTGDGLMMTLAMAVQDKIKNLDKVLQIFDGMEMPADSIQEIGTHMNWAAYQAWQAPTITSVMDSYANFQRNLGPDVIDEETALAILDQFVPSVRSKIKAKNKNAEPTLNSYDVTVKGIMENIRIDLAFANESITSRQKVLSKVSTWTDQMAGANAPYHNEGLDIGSTPEEQVTTLNNMLNEAIKEKQEAVPYAEPNEALTKRIKEISEPVTDGVYRLNMGQLRSLFPLMSKQSQDYYRDILRYNMPNDIQVFYGTEAELEAYRAAKLGSKPLKKGASGQYDRNNNTLLLVEDQTLNNTIGETIIHELTHVSIADKIEAYYSDSDMEPTARDAVGRLVALASDFLDLNFSKDTDSVKNTVAALRRLRNADGVMTAKAVNEVIAELLTNPDLIPVAKQQKVNNPVIKITRDILKALKAIFTGWLRQPDESYFSNARFNVEILSRVSLLPPTGTDAPKGSEILNQIKSTSGKAAQTGSTIRAAVQDALLRSSLNQPSLAAVTGTIIGRESEVIIGDFTNAGFDFNPEEAITFKEIMSLFLSDAKLNGPVLVRAQEVFDKAISDLTVESFMENEAANDPSDRLQAQDKYNMVIGLSAITKKDNKGRSLNLPSFLALAASNDEFGNILSKLEPPKKEALSYDSVDDALTSMTSAALDTLVAAVVGEHKGYNTKQAVDNIVSRLSAYEMEKQTVLENIYQNSYSMIDEKAAGLVDKGATALVERLDTYRKTLGNPIAQLPVSMAQGAVGLLSKSKGLVHAEAITETLNTAKVPHVVNELFSQFRGRTPSNAKIYDMINRVKFAISSIREEFREQYPIIIQENFSRKLTKAEWSAMHKGIGQTDLGFLHDKMDPKQIARLFSDTTFRKAEIAKAKTGISGGNVTQAEALAEHMVNKKASYMMRRNAFAINASKEAEIEKLVTLLAIDKMNADNRKTVSNLFINENKGMMYALSQMAYFRELEYAKHKNNPIVRMNQWKGHIPSENGAGVSLVLAENTPKKHREMALQGYERVSDYGGMSADHRSANMSYYRTNTNSQNPYTQGVAQTVQASQNGIDIKTGRSVNGNTIGLITGPYMKVVLSRMQSNQKTAGDEYLLPVFDESGNVIALERAMRTDMLNQKGKDTHFGKMLGAMAGRQVEEYKSREFNKNLVKEVKIRYDEDKRANKADEYTNIATSTDPIHKDTWKTIPREMKEDLEEIFGQKDYFPVRNDMIPIVVGYRNPEASDLWSGVSRIPEPVRKAITDTLTKIMGRKAYDYVINAGKIWSTLVSEAKTLIVVKSVIVPAFNIASNIVQLSMRGVPLRTIVTLGPQKFTEITKYNENQDTLIKLHADQRATSNQIEKDKIQAKIDGINSVNRRMSIWPLIEAGEFSTISEGLNELDVSLREGRIGEWVEQQVDKLPESVRTLGRYAVISRSTALYKGLNRTVQYGDFMAKAILYDDMVTRQKLDQAEALSKITEEFVNYNVPVGRSQTFLENFGLLWFPRFKIGATKIAIQMIRDNPIRALMGTMMVANFDFLGSPVSDNLGSSIIDGRFDNAVGIGMGLRAPSLHPVANIMGL